MHGKILELGCGEFPLFKNSVKGDIVKIKNYRQVDCNKILPFKIKSFDTIVALELIEHLHNPQLFLKECHRILREGGFLIISTPNILYWKTRIKLLIGNSEWFDITKNSGHLLFFNPNSLKKIVENFGFETILIKPIGLTKILFLCGGFVYIGRKQQLE